MTTVQTTAAIGDALIPNWSILTSDETDHEYRIRVKYLLAASACPHCISLAEHTRFGKRQQRFRDLPRQGKPVSILVQRQRRRCRSCEKTFLDPLPDMDGRHRITKRLLEYILHEAHTRTFVSIAAEVGLSEGSIRNIHHDTAVNAENSLAVQIGTTERTLQHYKD